MVDRTYGDILWPDQCRIVALIREGDLVAITPETSFRAADEVLAVVHSEALSDLAELLGRGHTSSA